MEVLLSSPVALVLAGLLGHLVATADEPPTPDAQFLIQVVAQQTGVAVSNARMHQRERSGAHALEAHHTSDSVPRKPMVSSIVQWVSSREDVPTIM